MPESGELPAPIAPKFPAALAGGVVGLGIVAAMNGPTSRSGPVPIVGKRVCFDRGSEASDGLGAGVGAGVVVFELGSPPPAPMVAPVGWGDLVWCCFLCGKRMDNLDAFIYRGEKAFCSEECRYHYITDEEDIKGRNVSEVIKPLGCSISPCSIRFLFAEITQAA